MLDQMNQCCDIHNLLPDNQSVYREHKSCKTVLLKLTNNLLWSMERKNVTVLITLDLSVACNTVDHSVLLTTLQSNFGIHRTPLDWFPNYLAPMNMKIIIGNTYSDERTLLSQYPGVCVLEQIYSICTVTLLVR